MLTLFESIAKLNFYEAALLIFSCKHKPLSLSLTAKLAEIRPSEFFKAKTSRHLCRKTTMLALYGEPLKSETCSQ
jgi:hypothetical protein